MQILLSLLIIDEEIEAVANLLVGSRDGILTLKYSAFAHTLSTSI